MLVSDVRDMAGTRLAVRDSVMRRVFAPTSVIFGVLIVVCAVGVRIPEWLQYLPFALSLVLFGLPHGALDHLVPARLAGRRPTVASVARVVLLYAALGVPVFAVWAVAPGVAFVGFILLTWWHWGLGDLYSLLAHDDVAHLRSRSLRMLAAVIRGALPMLVPLIAFPAAYSLVAVQATRVFDAGAVPTDIPAPVQLAAALVLAVLVVGYLVATAIAARRVDAVRGWQRDVAELALLMTFFSVVPPVLAVGLYFSLWHALRHIVRLALLDSGLGASASPLARGQLLLALRSFARDSSPVTAIAIAILGALAVLLPPNAANGTGLGLYLVLISALTVPHAVIVAYMDHRQGLWARN